MNIGIMPAAAPSEDDPNAELEDARGDALDLRVLTVAINRLPEATRRAVAAELAAEFPHHYFYLDRRARLVTGAAPSSTA